MDDCAEEELCRICYSEINPVTRKKDLIAPCKCSGSVKYVHFTCLKLWRMRGKAFGDMGKCEQCHGAYNIPGERVVYSCLISLSSIFLISSVYLFVSLIIRKTGETIAEIIEETCCTLPLDSNICLYDFDKSHYLSCLMFLLAIYKMMTKPGLLLIGGYIFSYFTLAVYHLAYSRLLFFCISFKFLADVYFETYKMIDGFYYYLLNLNWEKKYLKRNS